MGTVEKYRFLQRVATPDEKLNMADTRFRGAWSPQIANPHVKSFLPTAPPAIPAPAKAEDAPAPPPYKAGDKKNGPPDDAEVSFNIRDRYNNWRGYIAKDGSCFNNTWQLIGYIEGHQAGSINSEYLGQVTEDWHIEDSNDKIVALIDPGRAIIREMSQNDIICEMDKSGCIKAGENLTYLGQFEPFTFHDMKIIGLYLLLIDP